MAANRTKTIEFAFPARLTSLASATRNDFAAITLDIPETTSRTFRSVIVQVGCRDTNTAATSLTNPLVGVKLGAAAFGDTTLGNPVGNSGESQAYIFWRDATAYFNTNFGSGASQTCQVGVNFTGPSTINISVKLYVTYEYDDTAHTTEVKTVTIPLESGTGALTATLAEIGTNQIPALDTFLPEASKSYKNIWFELYYNEFTTGTANDAQLGMRVRSDGTENLTGLHESSLASSPAGFITWDQGASPVWSTASAQAFYLRSSTITTASTFNHVAVLLKVTYTYDKSTTTTVINSLTLTLPFTQLPGHTTSSDATRMGINLWIEEPATITLVQSGALVSYNQTAAVGPSCAFGAQSFRSYTDTSVANCGCTYFTQRVDSGSAGGSAFTLARGKNSLAWRLYMGTAGVTPSGFSCILYLNYTSAVASGGIGTHNHSTMFSIQQSQASGVGGNITASQWLYVLESNWFRNNFAFWCCSYMGWTTTTAATQILFEVENASGELEGTGFGTCFQGAFGNNDGESSLAWVCCNMLHQGLGDWDRWASDPDTARRNLTSSRRIRFSIYPAGTRALAFWLTHHSIARTISGTISGSAGGTVNYDAHVDDELGELIKTGSRSGNGSYSITWYDDTVNVQVRAKESSTLVGASDVSAAT